MSAKYYVVWIEGLSPKTGEKIKSLQGENSYTTKMTEAMRVLPADVERVKTILRERGVSEWTLQTCMVETTYAPKDTIFCEGLPIVTFNF